MPAPTLPTLSPTKGAEAPSDDQRPGAVVYCEGNFAAIDGKTANGLVRSSERYRIVAVIDSTHAGRDAGQVLDGVDAGIPVVASLAEVLVDRTAPQLFIFGLAPLSGLMSRPDRAAVLEAILAGLDIVSGLHEFLNEDPEISAAAATRGVTLLDVRRPRATKDLRMFDGAIHAVESVRIAILGTDGAIGKRTTSTILTRSLNEAGIHAVMVGTGQTGLIQGAAYGVALDAIPAQFGVGELEGAVVKAWDETRPDVIVIEGQGALSHPAYLSSTVILRASRPHAVILQHAPGRRVLSDYPAVPMPTPDSERMLIEQFGKTRVIGITINHENLTEDGVTAVAGEYADTLGLPATDPLWGEPGALVAMVTAAFPHLLSPESRVVA
ncbi:MAG: DUF1611 domain-containing protein [Nocardioides sp.]